MSYRSTLSFLAFFLLCGCATSGTGLRSDAATSTYSDTDLYSTAVHEAGHAVARTGYFGAASVTDIHLHVASSDAVGHDHIGIVMNDGTPPKHWRNVRARIVEFRIGIIAEKMLTSSETGGMNDLAVATDIAWMLYAHEPWRTDRKSYVKKTAPRQIREKVEFEIQIGDRCAELMVLLNRRLILDLAAFIVAKPTVNGMKTVSHEEFVRFMRGRHVETVCHP